MKHFISRVQRQVLAGLILIVPFAVTIIAAVFIYNLIDRFVGPLVDKIVPPPSADIAGQIHLVAVSIRVLFTIFMTILMLYLAGFVSTTIVTHKFYEAGEQLVLKIPLVKTIYGTTKQIVHLVSIQKSMRFKRLALIEFPRPGILAVGLVTGETHIAGDPRRFVSVFLPTTPNPTSGFLLILPDDQVRAIDIGIEEGIKLIMSGGMIIPDMLTPQPLPAAREDSGEQAT